MAGPKPDITSLPAYPVRGEDRDTFATKANAYVQAQSDTFVPEMNDALDWINVVLGEFLVFLAAVQDAEGLPALSGNIGKVLTVTGTPGSESVGYEKASPGLEWQTGLTVSFGSNYVHTTSSGAIMDSTDTYRIVLPSTMEKNAGATWAAGNGNGSYSNAELAIAANTWYTDYLVSKKSDLSDTDIVTATTQANALADTNVIAAGYDIARPYFGGLRTNSSPNAFYSCASKGNHLYKWSTDAITGTRNNITLATSDVQDTFNITSPKNHNAICAITLDAGGISVAAFFGEESIGYIAVPSTTSVIDFFQAKDWSSINKVINSESNQQGLISLFKSISGTVNVTINTQGFYHNLDELS